MPEALLAEARENDLLVIGLPERAKAEQDPVVAAVLQVERPLLRSAECMLLAVARPPEPVGSLLVNYEGGIGGKSALRVAGEIAMHASAKVCAFR